LLLEIETSDSGVTAVRSPGVGWWSEHPHRGALVGPGSRVGTLEVQNRRYRLVLPDGAGGRVVGELPGDRTVAVEHGQVLFRLAPLADVDAADVDGDRGSLGHPGGADLPEDCRAVVAPTDGVFYTRPSPDAAPFVEAGAPVRAGDPVGLVEVMKTFNQIVYGGPGYPETGTVAEVRVADGQEIRAGDVLVVVQRS
jgi:biotin carboxyl carrier protein